MVDVSCRYEEARNTEKDTSWSWVTYRGSSESRVSRREVAFGRKQRATLMDAESRNI